MLRKSPADARRGARLNPAWIGRWLHRHRDPARIELDVARKLLCRLKSTDPWTQRAAGAGVQLANSDFVRRFSGVESFRRIPDEEQERFWKELSDLELALRSQELGMAIGVGLYRIWLADLLADRHDVAQLLGEELAELSRAGFGRAAA